jgi:hypothetical protein
MMFLSIALGAAILAAVFLFLFFKLAARPDFEMVDAAWFDKFSVANYAPMERLLDQTDFAFLASQPGYNPRIAKTLLAQRRKAFNGYLRLLISDFNQLHAIARGMLVHSPADRPAFARALRRQHAMFFLAVFEVRCKVAFYPWGWTALDVPRLFHSLDQMGNQVKELASRRVNTEPA